MTVGVEWSERGWDSTGPCPTQEMHAGKGSDMLKISDNTLTAAVNLERGAEVVQIFRQDDGVNAFPA